MNELEEHMFKQVVRQHIGKYSDEQLAIIELECDTELKRREIREYYRGSDYTPQF